MLQSLPLHCSKPSVFNSLVAVESKDTLLISLCHVSGPSDLWASEEPTAYLYRIPPVGWFLEGCTSKKGGSNATTASERP
jgi:hypothetical protein